MRFENGTLENIFLISSEVKQMSAHLRDFGSLDPDTAIKQILQWGSQINYFGSPIHKTVMFKLYCNLVIVQEHYVYKTMHIPLYKKYFAGLKKNVKHHPSF